MDPLLIYNGSEGEEVYYTVRRVKLTETVTEIPEEAFSQCSMLFTVELNKGLKTIGRCAFDRCISLKYINFPSTIVTIEASAFNGCKSLESLLKSSLRPQCWTWSFDSKDYNQSTLGWNFQESECHTDLESTSQKSQVYDTSHPGYGNQGHLYGDQLTDQERSALLEYLKTL